MRDYHHTKFGLIWVKEGTVIEGADSTPSPQAENVLNRPGEIGLNVYTFFTHPGISAFTQNKRRFLMHAPTLLIIYLILYLLYLSV